MGLLGACACGVAVADRGEDLIAALSSEDPAVRRAAYTEIAVHEFETYHIPAVAALLDHEDPDVVRGVSLALEGIIAPSTDAEGLREIVGEKLCDAIDAVENDHWLFWLLSYSGEPNVAARVGKMFGDAPFADVVLVLEGIGGEASVKALVRQLTKSTPDERVGLLHALGNLGGETAIAALLNQATQPDPVGIAAIEALGSIATPRALPVIETRLDDTFDPIVFSAYLKTIRTLPAEDALAAYDKLLKDSADSRVQAAALTGLANTGDDAAIRTLLTALYSDDPAIHGAARNGLITIENDTADRVLVAAQKSAGPESKGVMLEILHARDPSAAVPLLEQALTDPNPEVQLSAITVLGQTPNPNYEAAFRNSAENGAVLVKRPALRAYLALASTLEADSENALRIYRDAFELATENDERREALRGMGRTGGVTTLAALQQYQAIPGIGDAISECAMAIAERIAEAQPGIAERVYEGIATRGAPHLAMRAVDGLRAMDIERDFAREAGFLTQWKLIGPFPNEGIDTPSPPETEFDGNAEYDGVDGKKVRWTNVRTPHIRGILDLMGLIQPNQNTVAYARAEFSVAEAGEAQLLLGSDDGIACWFNGERVHTNEVDRGLTPDSDKVPVQLKAGTNIVLLKITQKEGGWAFCARVTDPDGKPITFDD